MTVSYLLYIPLAQGAGETAGSLRFAAHFLIFCEYRLAIFIEEPGYYVGDS